MLDGVDAHLRVLAFLHGTTDVINRFTAHKQAGLSGRSFTAHSSVKVTSLRRCNESVRPEHGDRELNELIENFLLPVVRRREEYWALVAQEVRRSGRRCCAMVINTHWRPGIGACHRAGRRCSFPR